VASSTQDNVNSTQGAAPTVGVGQSLKTAREQTGKSMDEVAEHLRIRQPFLEALEDGRHKDLPGGTYAIGFLRTYAEFLGLDGEEMVRRFRAEAAGELNARSELVFPSPVSEGRIPGGAVLFLGLMLAGIAYAGWYFLSSRSSEVAEIVPPLPDRLASVLNRQANLTGETAKPAEAPKAEPAAPQPKADDAQPKSDEGVPAPVTTGKEAEVVPPQEDDDSKPAAAAVPAAPVAAPAPVVAAKPEPVKPEPAKIEPPKAAVQPVAAKPEAPKPETAKPAEAAAPAAPAPVPAPATAPAPAAAVTPAVAPVPDGKVLGQEHTDARIQIKATGDDCWVQVREMDGQLLLSRLLRRGDSYMVPNRSGLTLMVGNAGALELSVDGKKAPALGNPGQVRRDIKLDPDKLLGGG
jgi:cytoskeleton protein RodZ